MFLYVGINFFFINEQMSQNLINFGNLITEAEKLLIIKTVYKNLVLVLVLV